MRPGECARDSPREEGAPVVVFEEDPDEVEIYNAAKEQL